MKYRLKKDLPGVPASTESDKYCNTYIFHKTSGLAGYIFSQKEIDNNPDFFELVEEKKEVFKTEDDVRIFEDTVGTVYGILLHSAHEILLEKKLPWDGKNGRFAENRKWFYHRPEAKQYLLENYPCLSYLEARTVCPAEDHTIIHNKVTDKLKKIVPELF